jgi:tight adherence protein C
MRSTVAAVLGAAAATCAVVALRGLGRSAVVDRAVGRGGAAARLDWMVARGRATAARIGGVDVPIAPIDRASLARRLRAAGVDATASEAVGLRRIATIGGLLAALGVPTLGPALGPIGAVVGFTAPGFALSRRRARRLARMDEELPQLLDLLAAASHAGLAGVLALRRAVEATRGPLADELRRVVDAVDLGGRWRDELRACASRVEIPDLQRAVNALTRTETLGASLSDAMVDLAARVREARRIAAAERARTAPVKMLFPLVFLILPAFLLLTVVPVLFSTVESIR